MVGNGMGRGVFGLDDEGGLFMAFVYRTCTYPIYVCVLLKLANGGEWEG